MSISHFIGKNGVTYYPDEFRDGFVPVTAYPLKAVYEPLPPRGPMPKFHVIPMDAWKDPNPWPRPEDMKVELLVLKKEDIRIALPPPSEPRKIPGMIMVAEGAPYFFERKCPCCGGELAFLGNDESSWVHYYECFACEARIIMTEGDKMGGGFDHWEMFMKERRTKDEHAV